MSKRNTPNEAYIISLLAGLIIGIVGFVWTYLMVIGWSFEWMNWYDSFMHSNDEHFHFMGTGMLGYSFGFIGVILGFAIMLSAVMLRNNPQDHGTWGTVILILSVFSILGGMGGMGIGLILGVIGGILAIMWTPSSGSYSSNQV